MAVREAIRSLDPTARADEFCAVLGETHRALMRNILTWESDGVWARDGLPDLGRWIALRFDITLYRARRWIACAHKLEELPLTSLAVERGELGLDKAVELTRFATPEDEARLIRWARRNTVTDIRLRADEPSQLRATRCNRPNSVATSATDGRPIDSTCMCTRLSQPTRARR